MTHPTDVSFEWIDSDVSLREFVESAKPHDLYFLDTEFHREKTYFPQLALIQIAVGERLAVIDPLRVDAEILRPLFESKATCVLHAKIEGNCYVL